MLLRSGCWRIALFLAGIMLLTVPGVTSAHEGRTLVGGKYQAVGGFLNEPAIEGQMNGSDSAVTSSSPLPLWPVTSSNSR